MSDDPYKLVSRLAMLDFPPEGRNVQTADDFLEAYAAGCDSSGRYYASAPLLRRLVWWQMPSAEQVSQWRDELTARGDLTVRPLGLDIYSDGIVQVACLEDTRRFPRFAERKAISSATRQLIYRRDGHRCVTCGSLERLTLDHIYPWSLGGSDEPSNLQTMCQPCNSRKGARVS